MQPIRPALTTLLLLVLIAACSGPTQEQTTESPAETAESQVVNVYSARHYDSDDQIYAAFEAATGIRVEIIEGNSAALLERLQREGDLSPADVFVAVDAGRLHQAEVAGIFDPVDSETLNQRIPENLRHPDGLWFGFTKRARIIVYSNERVEEGAIADYEDLADPEWHGRVLIRSSSNVYNQSLMGSLVAANGEAAAETWCQALVQNLARKPQGGDRDQIRAVAAGEGDVAVVNSYYLARMVTGDDQADREAASKVQPLFPNQAGRGTHVNISGAGVVRGAPNRENAIRLIEFLVSQQAQEMMAEGTGEFPVISDVATETAIFDPFVEDTINASVFGGQGQQTMRLMDRCGWR